MQFMTLLKTSLKECICGKARKKQMKILLTNITSRLVILVICGHHLEHWHILGTTRPGYFTHLQEMCRQQWVDCLTTSQVSMCKNNVLQTLYNEKHLNQLQENN